MPTSMQPSIADWLDQHPEIQSLRIAAADLNGIARGKRIPAAHGAKLDGTPVRMPYSALNVDIWGRDIENSPLVFDSGDADGVLHMTERGPVPMPWLATPAALVPCWMFHPDGTPFAGDARHALAVVQNRLNARGLTPVIGSELEFYLCDDSELSETGAIHPPQIPGTGQRRRAGDVLSLAALDGFDGFFSDLYAACDSMGIPADAATSESGVCQFEITLKHQTNVLRAADDIYLFKMLTRGMARKHGFAASFMAKPYKHDAGNGLHMHCSLLDDAGRNIFDDGSEIGSPALRHAIRGALQALADSALFFAPHANSYARLVPEAHAPTGICWGYDNRTVALRVPDGPPKARRIEHRVAGGDVNPYLAITAMLGGILNGIEDAIDPPAPVSGNAYGQNLPQMPGSWDEAQSSALNSPHVARIFPPELIRYLTDTKRQEATDLNDGDHAAQLVDYLDIV